MSASSSAFAKVQHVASKKPLENLPDSNSTANQPALARDLCLNLPGDHPFNSSSSILFPRFLSVFGPGNFAPIHPCTIPMVSNSMFHLDLEPSSSSIQWDNKKFGTNPDQWRHDNQYKQGDATFSFTFSGPGIQRIVACLKQMLQEEEEEENSFDLCIQLRCVETDEIEELENFQEVTLNDIVQEHEDYNPFFKKAMEKSMFTFPLPNPARFIVPGKRTESTSLNQVFTQPLHLELSIRFQRRDEKHEIFNCFAKDLIHVIPDCKSLLLSVFFFFFFNMFFMIAFFLYLLYQMTTFSMNSDTTFKISARTLKKTRMNPSGFV